MSGKADETGKTTACEESEATVSMDCVESSGGKEGRKSISRNAKI